MDAVTRLLRRAAITVAGLSVMVSLVQAQANRVEIEAIEFDEVRTPRYYRQSSHRKADSPQREWFQIGVKYKAHGGNDEWIDEVTFQWHVEIQRPGQSLLLIRSATYIDVEEGTHRAVVFIRPRFIERYTGRRKLGRNEVRVMVRAFTNGELTSYYHYPPGRPSWEWWNSTNSERKDRELMLRHETPFAPLDWEFYQVLKPEP